MGDSVSRRQADQALFGTGNRRHLVEVIKQADPHLVAAVIVKALELQIAAEEFARAAGVEIDEERLGEFIRSRRGMIAEQLDRAVNAFICSVVSQEG